MRTERDDTYCHGFSKIEDAITYAMIFQKEYKDYIFNPMTEDEIRVALNNTLETVAEFYIETEMDSVPVAFNPIRDAEQYERKVREAIDMMLYDGCDDKPLYSSEEEKVSTYSKPT